MPEITSLAEPPNHSLGEVEKFITLVWAHPLVSQKEREHRLKGNSKVIALMQSFDIPHSAYFAVPFGSTRWVVNPTSDFDADVYITDNEMRDRFKIPGSGFSIAENGVHIQYPHILDNLFNKTNSVPTIPGNLCNLFFTPDEYIIGNIQLADDTRLKAVRFIEENMDLQLLWNNPDSLMNKWFNQLFRDWGSGKRHYSSFIDRSFTIGDRTRYLDAIDKRSKQTHSPKRWKETFEKAKERLTIPSFIGYKQAVYASDGALHLREQYSALGING